MIIRSWVVAWGLLGLLEMAEAAEAAKSWYKSDFTHGLDRWTAWTHVGKVTQHRENSQELQAPIQVFTISHQSWNTPIRAFETPIPVSMKTMIRVKIRTENGRDWEMVVHDRKGANSYEIPVSTPAREWTVVQRYLYKGVLKQSKSGHAPGLLGDQISRIQFTTSGPKVEIAEVDIFEAEKANLPELPVSIVEHALAEYHAKQQMIDYPVLRRNGFFPYGPVMRLDANRRHQEWLGRDFEKGFREDLEDMKRHYCNTYLNFCDSSPFPLRYALTQSAGMRLIDTAFSNRRIGELPDDDPAIRTVRAYSRHPALLAWYGQDEPASSQVPDFLRNKRRFMALDPAHPFVSAFPFEYVRKSLGSAMEVLMPDPYVFVPHHAAPAVGAILGNHQLIRNAIGYSCGHRVWYMTQTFSNRHQRQCGRARFSARYPTPEETRLDLWSAVAAGADGILFFIYNDFVPFMGGFRGEKFDRTLVDAWGNGNDVYGEIAEFGRRIVPIMPSIMDAELEPMTLMKTNPKLLMTQQRNALGQYLFIVNKTQRPYHDEALDMQIPQGAKAYRLTALKEFDGHLDLALGEGEMLAVTAPENFQLLKEEISARRRERQQGIHPQSPALTCLEPVQKALGDLNRFLCAPERIVSVDGQPEVRALNRRLQAISRKYFKLRYALKQRPPEAAADTETGLPAMLEAIRTLRESYGKLTERP